MSLKRTDVCCYPEPLPAAENEAARSELRSPLCHITRKDQSHIRSFLASVLNAPRARPSRFTMDLNAAISLTIKQYVPNARYHRADDPGINSTVSKSLNKACAIIAFCKHPTSPLLEASPRCSTRSS